MAPTVVLSPDQRPLRLIGIVLGVLVLAVAIVATGGLAAPIGVGVVGGFTALELTAATLLLSGATLVAADQVVNSGAPSLGLPGSGLPGPGPPRGGDPFPVGPIVGAAVAAVAAAMGAEEILGPERGPPPPVANPHHYVDSQGNLRWRDTNQLVEQFPTRPTFIDDEGVERWSDTETLSPPLGTTGPSSWSSGAIRPSSTSRATASISP